jgi:hypothetical protein
VIFYKLPQKRAVLQTKVFICFTKIAIQSIFSAIDKPHFFATPQKVKNFYKKIKKPLDFSPTE